MCSEGGSLWCNSFGFFCWFSRSWVCLRWDHSHQSLDLVGRKWDSFHGCWWFWKGIVEIRLHLMIQPEFPIICDYLLPSFPWWIRMPLPWGRFLRRDWWIWSSWTWTLWIYPGHSILGSWVPWQYLMVCNKVVTWSMEDRSHSTVDIDCAQRNLLIDSRV